MTAPSDGRAGPRGFVYVCDRQGRVARIARHDLGGPAYDRPSSLGDMTEGDSRAKIDHFLASVIKDGVAYRWEVNFLIKGTFVVFLLAGYLDGDDLVVIGAEDPPLFLSLIEEMTAINNEYASLLRQEIRSTTLRPLHSHGTVAALDEMSSLNNELVALSRRLEKSNRELQRSIDERNRWIGIIAHDLRNPLGVISAYAELLETILGDRLDEKVDDFLASIRASSHYMQGLINQYIDLAAIETGHLALRPTAIDLVPLLLRRCVSLNGVLAERKGIALALANAPAALPATLDALKIEQVLNNVIGNAVKYTPEGGTIEVDLEAPEGMARIAVRDTGPGIAPEAIERVFKPFQTAGNRPTGGESATGLGLAICQRIVEGHGGRIQVDSNIGQGSTFVITLPVGQAPTV